MDQGAGHMQNETNKPEHHEHKHNGFEHVCPPSRMARGGNRLGPALESMRIAICPGFRRLRLSLGAPYGIQKRLWLDGGRHVAMQHRARPPPGP